MHRSTDTLIASVRTEESSSRRYIGKGIKSRARPSVYWRVDGHVHQMVKTILLSESLIQALNVLYPLGRGHPIPHDLEVGVVRSEVLSCVQNRQGVPKLSYEASTMMPSRSTSRDTVGVSTMNENTEQRMSMRKGNALYSACA